MKLWLDDVRDPPDGWTWVKTVEEAKTAFLSGVVTDASLDHDLGEFEPTGYDLCCWMEEVGFKPPRTITVHSQNPVGRERMRVVLRKLVEAGR